MRYVLFALLGLLLLPRPAAAQWREAWAFEPQSPPDLVTAPALFPAEEAIPLGGVEPTRSAAVGNGMLVGALLGAVVGASAFLTVEIFSSHTDHRYDGLAAALLIGGGTLIGWGAGLVYGLVVPL
jgi:hypothetical protein